MEKQIEKGKEIIKIFINSGYEAYLIGQCVRNSIIGIPFETVEITTNAIPSKISEIFSFTKVDISEEGTYVLYYGYDFLITTFRLDNSYSDKRNPIKQHYSKNLLDELARRDFTINALAMSHNEKITDAYLGFRDIQKKKIKTIGNPRVRINEDPTRILIAISLMSELGFKIDSKTTKAINRRKKLLNELPIKNIYNQMEQIVVGQNARRAFSFMYENGIHRYLPSLNKGMKKLAKRRFNVQSIEQLLGSCALVDENFNIEYFEYVEDKEFLLDIIELAYKYPKAQYPDLELFNYGLDAALEANTINYLVGKSRNYKRKINKQFSNLVIKDINELALSKTEIMSLAASKPIEVVNDLIEDVVVKILNNELNNDADLIKIYCINKLSINMENTFEEEHLIEETSESVLEQKDFDFDDNAVENLVNVTNEDELEENLFQQGQVVKSYTELKINQLEKRLHEQEKLLKEKDLQLYELEKRTLQEKLNNDIDKLVQRNLDNLRELNYIDTSYSEKITLGRELQKVYRQFLSSIDGKYKQIFNEEDKNNEN